MRPVAVRREPLAGRRRGGGVLAEPLDPRGVSEGRRQVHVRFAGHLEDEPLTRAKHVELPLATLVDAEPREELVQLRGAQAEGHGRSAAGAEEEDAERPSLLELGFVQAEPPAIGSRLRCREDADRPRRPDGPARPALLERPGLPARREIVEEAPLRLVPPSRSRQSLPFTALTALPCTDSISRVLTCPAWKQDHCLRGSPGSEPRSLDGSTSRRCAHGCATPASAATGGCDDQPDPMGPARPDLLAAVHRGRPGHPGGACGARTSCSPSTATTGAASERPSWPAWVRPPTSSPGAGRSSSASAVTAPSATRRSGGAAAPVPAPERHPSLGDPRLRRPRRGSQRGVPFDVRRGPRGEPRAGARPATG